MEKNSPYPLPLTSLTEWSISPSLQKVLLNPYLRFLLRYLPWELRSALIDTRCQPLDRPELVPFPSSEIGPSGGKPPQRNLSFGNSRFGRRHRELYSYLLVIIDILIIKFCFSGLVKFIVYYQGVRIKKELSWGLDCTRRHGYCIHINVERGRVYAIIRIPMCGLWNPGSTGGRLGWSYGPLYFLWGFDASCQWGCFPAVFWWGGQTRNQGKSLNFLSLNGNFPGGYSPGRYL